MLVGVPKEIKNFEYRVGLTPGSVKELTQHGHQVLVQQSAGEKIGFADHDYLAAGASIVPTANEVYQEAEMIVKVKEPQPEECQLLRPQQILFAYLHLAPDPVQTALLQASGCVAIAYETVTNDLGGLPLLAPMSEVAGRLSIQAAANCLETKNGGNGKLLSGVPGVEPAKVVILGGGVVGANAISIAIGMGANVVVLDKSHVRLTQLDLQFSTKINTVISTTEAIERHLPTADVVIGAVLVRGASAPKIITAEMVRTMCQGSVIVDVSIDQGGCVATSKATTHQQPTYLVDGVVHYCVANMPGAVPWTATLALNNATLPFVLTLANDGYKKAMRLDPHLLAGLNIADGKVTYKAVAEALNLPYTPAQELIGE